MFCSLMFISTLSSKIKLDYNITVEACAFLCPQFCLMQTNIGLADVKFESDI